jgi:two-component system, cell cycle response regulator
MSEAAIALALPRRGTFAAVRAWNVYLVAGIAAIAAYYQLPKAGWAQCVLLVALNATAAALPAWAAWRTRGWARVTWIALAVAMLLSAAGNAGYFGYPLVKHQLVPFPSHVDTLLLAAFPFFALALIALAQVHRGARWRGSRLATVAIAGGSSFALWKLMVEPTADVPLPHFAHQVSVAYPVLYVALFVMLVWFALRARAWNMAAGWIVVSYVVALVGQMVFSAKTADFTYAYGGVTDALWMLSYLLIGVAALSARRQDV